MQTVEGLLRSLFAKAGRSPPSDLTTLARTLRALTAGLVLQAGGNGPACPQAGAGSIVTRFLLGALGPPDCEELGVEL